MTNKTKKSDFLEILSKISSDKRMIADKLVSELSFMEETLEDLKEQIRKTGTIEQFEQGRQSFLRESPALKSYNTTVQRYSMLYRQLCDLAGKTQEAEKSNPVYEFLKEGTPKKEYRELY